MNFKYEIKTNKSFQTAIEDITDSLKEREFGVLYQVNFKEKIEAKGLDFSTNFEVLEVCNPGKQRKYWKKVLKQAIFYLAKSSFTRKKVKYILDF